VPAGNEVFEQPLVRSLVRPLAGASWDDLEALGHGTDDSTRFGLTPFALRTSGHRNGVSRLHGEVARAMWAPLWPQRSPADVPIGHVTNGVHPRTWLAPRLAELLAACGVDLDRGEAWERALGLDLDALAALRRAGKEALLRGLGLDPDALTIGFARRFATYKRAGLLLSRREELAALLADDERPLQILFAGKAHPNDAEGKAMLAEVLRFCRSAEAGGRAVFVENYEIRVARELVQGVDVWLNVPRRGEEASGTSGMKAALNGALNLSVLDGWWDEGFDAAAGWAIAGSGAGSDQYAADAAELFRLLEDEVLPEYYGGGWIERSRAAIARTGERFSSQRMVREYVEGYYAPAARAAEQPASALPD
jgi:starch phosphorylase